MTDVKLDPTGAFLTLPHANTSSRFHAIWLRDNAHDPRTRATGSGQRLITLHDIPAETVMIDAQIVGGDVCITFAPEGKTITYDLGWLFDHAYDREVACKRGWTLPDTVTWDASLDVPSGDFRTLKHDKSALQSWLAELIRYGFAKVESVPIHEEALFEIVDMFGHVRETNYGRLFNVRTEVNPTNLAFTGLGLQAHTDNPYRDPVPTVQVLHCLESSAAGGENMVVDGFAAAQRLRNENADYFDVLADHCARFEYAGEADVCLTARRPMIELAPDGELIGVRFNNRSLAAVTDVPFDKMHMYYAAYRRFGEIIGDAAMEVTFRLNPGEAFVVNNTRVLHARKGYAGVGTRWLQGCYADMDGVRSTHDAMSKGGET